MHSLGIKVSNGLYIPKGCQRLQLVFDRKQLSAAEEESMLCERPMAVDYIHVLEINLTKNKQIRMVLITFSGPAKPKSLSERHKARVTF